MTSGGGLTLIGAVTVQDDNSLQVGYNVDSQSSSTGPHSITVSTDSGSDTDDNVTVGDPPPSITNYTPQSPWTAGGGAFTLSVTGTGFGTYPQLSITSDTAGQTPYSGLTLSNVQSSAGTSITATVAIDPSAPGGTAYINVAACYVSTCGSGIGGNGFAPGQPGEPQNAQQAVNINADQVPTPHILLFGQDVTNTNSAQNPQAVVAGQEIDLSVLWRNGGALQQQSWTGLPQNIIGGFNGAAVSNQAVNLPIANAGQCQTFSEGCLTFYFTSGTPGGQQQSVTYNYTLNGNNGPVNGSVNVFFTVTGPNPSPQDFTVNVGVIQNDTTVANNEPVQIMEGLQMAMYRGLAIGFRVTAPNPPQNWPQGSYSWVQLLAGDTIKYRGVQLGQPTYQQPASPVLDTIYPYSFVGNLNVQSDTATDTPGMSLSGPTCCEAARVFSATMYSLWTPAQAMPGCADNACTIPVPLGSVSWGFGCDSINTLNSNAPGNVSGWIMGCQNPAQPAQPQFQVNALYPNWTATNTKPPAKCN